VFTDVRASCIVKRRSSVPKPKCWASMIPIWIHHSNHFCSGAIVLGVNKHITIGESFTREKSKSVMRTKLLNTGKRVVLVMAIAPLKRSGRGVMASVLL
jgi:hypothetical protein